jgi:hypothetical protein
MVGSHLGSLRVALLGGGATRNLGMERGRDLGRSASAGDPRSLACACPFLPVGKAQDASAGPHAAKAKLSYKRLQNRGPISAGIWVCHFRTPTGTHPKVLSPVAIASRNTPLLKTNAMHLSRIGAVAMRPSSPVWKCVGKVCPGMETKKPT